IPARSARAPFPTRVAVVTARAPWRGAPCRGPKMRQLFFGRARGLAVKATCGEAGATPLESRSKLIANRTVQCEDKGIDKVHRERRIGICFVEGKELNEWLVREGWALNFEPYAKGRYLEPQRDAERNRRGIWNGCFAASTNTRNWRKNCPLIGSPCPWRGT